jgi:general secretion pathway protein K
MIPPQPSPGRGFALVIVMIVIAVLGLLAGGFAISMKVESRLAANASNDAEMEWLGRSGVELARYVIANSSGSGGGQNYSSLNQIWAGGPGAGNETNGPLAGISLTNNVLGNGSFSVRIVDLERKWNINMADEPLLRRALTVIGVDAGDAATIVDSILDWEDPDDNPRMSGAESDFYMTKDPPYVAKNGYVDDLSELLLVNGVTPDLYWGQNVSSHVDVTTGTSAGSAQSQPVYHVGLVDLFTPISAGRININTASAYVLQMLPGVDENIASNIIRARAGPDGVEGTDDDTPFTAPTALAASVPGLSPQAALAFGTMVSVQSLTYEVTVEAQIGTYQKRYVAIIQRSGAAQSDVKILQFSAL